MSLPPLVSPADDLTVDEVRRYSRHLIIPDVGKTGQRRLKNAKVLVVGAGGLGSPALLYLAAAGVGTLGVIDFDVVDESNLQRQIIHGQSDIGRPKAVSAMESIHEVNPLVNVVLHEERLDSDNAMQIFEPYDLIVDGTDNFATRYLVNDACVLLGKPYVWGSIYRFDGQASVFWAEHGPCYRCLYPEPPPPGHGAVLRRGRGARGAVRVHRLHPGQRGDQAHHRASASPLVGRLMIYDALEMTYRHGQGQEGPRVPGLRQEPHDHRADRLRGVLRHGLRGRRRRRRPGRPSPPPSSRTCSTATRTSSSSTSGSRTSTRSSPFPGAVLIPKGEFLSGAALERLPQDKRIVLHCKSGPAQRRGPGRGQGRRVFGCGSCRRRRAGLDQPGGSLASGLLDAGGSGSAEPRNLSQRTAHVRLRP